jgi:hypothetical protein
VGCASSAAAAVSSGRCRRRAGRGRLGLLQSRHGRTEVGRWGKAAAAVAVDGRVRPAASFSRALNHHTRLQRERTGARKWGARVPGSWPLGVSVTLTQPIGAEDRSIPIRRSGSLSGRAARSLAGRGPSWAGPQE